jgi:cytochrome c553
MQLKYFKSGARKSSSMNTIAKPLSEKDMRMLAVFFNQVE